MPTPSITTLSQQYGHARQTCAKALRTLEDEGLLTRIPGLGYYVTGTAAAGSSATADTVLGPLRPQGTGQRGRHADRIGCATDWSG